MGIAPATLSRGFRTAFGTTAARYRANMQAQSALRQILSANEPLAAIANICGFADQAHLSRAIRTLTDRSPAAWRRVKSVQDPKAEDL